MVANGRGTYLGLVDVEWDSGNKPDIDNVYFVYNTGNDGLYHLALVDDPAWYATVPRPAIPPKAEARWTEADARIRHAGVWRRRTCSACSRMTSRGSRRGRMQRMPRAWGALCRLVDKCGVSRREYRGGVGSLASWITLVGRAVALGIKGARREV